MGNAVYTFDHLLSLSHHKDAAKVSTAIEKVKLRVLKVCCLFTYSCPQQGKSRGVVSIIIIYITTFRLVRPVVRKGCGRRGWQVRWEDTRMIKEIFKHFRLVYNIFWE